MGFSGGVPRLCPAPGGLFSWLNSGERLRDAIPELTKAVKDLCGLIARDPWPEGEQRLQQAEALSTDAQELLATFERLLAENEAARGPGSVA